MNAGPVRRTGAATWAVTTPACSPATPWTVTDQAVTAAVTEFWTGDLRYVLLKLIADKPSHGYELIKEIEDRLGGAYSPSPGVIYPHPHPPRGDAGYIRPVEAEGARKAYAITDEGKKVLAENKAIVEEIFRRVSEAAEQVPSIPPHQIVRAMENLRLALRLRLERGKLTDEQIADVAAALDAAAQTLDRE